MIVISEGKAVKLTAKGQQVEKEELFELQSDQEETDTRVVLYAKYAAKMGYDNVRVRSPDSDLFFILLHHAQQIDANILFDTGTGNLKRLLNMTEIARDLGQKHSTALLGLHALTGCDTTSSFKGIGKKKPIKILQKMQNFTQVLCVLGDSWDPKERTWQSLNTFCVVFMGSQESRT